MKELEYDLLAIGGGTAGLVSAAGASYLGARAAIVEREALGGDCLWTGCVPSKALIASARLAYAMRSAGELGLTGASPRHAFGEVMERMRSARSRVARHDDPERFREMGVGVHFGAARFLAPDLVEVEGVGRIRSKRIVVASGARPAVPPVPGLEESGYLTHASAFDQDELPDTIVILGGGPVGLEFAQLYARLGARVTVVERMPRILPAEDPDVGDALAAILRDEGITVRTGANATSVERRDGEKVVALEGGDRLPADELFVATGRSPATDELDLSRAGVELDRGAVRVDETLRTTAPGVWAAGDVTGGLQFTHVADYMARTVVRNALLPFSTKATYENVPRVTYTDPEVAHVGRTQAEAEARGASTYTYDLSDLDRAIVDGRARGFVKVHADRRGKVLGATVLASGAGELVVPLVMARTHGISLADLSNTVFPYPTMTEGVKRAADLYQRGRLEGLAGRALRKVVAWLT